MSRILLVDDDKDHLKLFTMILEEQGHSVDTYTDSVVALSRFKPNYYNLSVLDYRMPELNGLDLYARIKEIDPTIKALILTASHEQITEEYPRENLKVIRKPITNEELLGEINSILTDHRPS